MSTDEEDELDAVEALVAQANAHGWADADEGDDDDMLARALALSLAEAAGGARSAGHSVDEPSGPGRPDAPFSTTSGVSQTLLEVDDKVRAVAAHTHRAALWSVVPQGVRASRRTAGAAAGMGAR